jgi:o-succinylbenzoate synthase
VSEALAALPPPSPAPAARCGVEAALLGLAASAAGCPVRRLLSPGAATVLSVNAACGIADDSLAARVSEAAAAGFRVFKVKIGVREWAEELRRLRELSLPRGTGLRLDANGAWGADEAAARLADLAGLPVESLEEPLAVFEAGTLARLQAGVEFSLALDESLTAGAQDLLDAGCPVRRIVLKPTVLGGAAPSIALARRAATLGIEVVVTTTLEAAPGRQLVAETAAATASRLAHGLDTGRWLGRDLARGPRIDRGRIRLDEG